MDACQTQDLVIMFGSSLILTRTLEEGGTRPWHSKRLLISESKDSDIGEGDLKQRGVRLFAWRHLRIKTVKVSPL